MQYVLSDIHGYTERFDSILNQIDLQPKDRLFILGDVIDRNPGGLSILDRIMAAPNMFMLLGNHEYMLLDFLAHPGDPVRDRRWRVRNGGQITWDDWCRRSPEWQRSALFYLNHLPLNIRVEQCGGHDWLLVHGAPVGMCPPDDELKHYAVWHRLTEDEPIPPQATGSATVIFGHTPTSRYRPLQPPEVLFLPDRIGIDCGCAYEDGRLACLRLDDNAVFYS